MVDAVIRKWNRNPRPDPKVLALIDSLRRAAEQGHIRCLGVVVVNPQLQVEHCFAGEEEDTGIRRRLLAGGMVEAVHALFRK